MKINFKNTKDWLFYWAVVGAGFFVLFFLVSSTWIGYSVREKCLLAQGRYGGDCVEALMAHLEDESNPYGERNSAIWALGQLGDVRAVPTLRKYYTGNIPDRESWNGTISQYELKKAIKLAEGSLNVTAFVWRYDLP
jgi:hypothetical protein